MILILIFFIILSFLGHSFIHSNSQTKIRLVNNRIKWWWWIWWFRFYSKEYKRKRKSQSLKLNLFLFFFFFFDSNISSHTRKEKEKENHHINCRILLFVHVAIIYYHCRQPLFFSHHQYITQCVNYYYILSMCDYYIILFGKKKKKFLWMCVCVSH